MSTSPESVPHYAVIVPAWNEAHFIEDTLRQLQVAISTVGGKAELIVVDNNSTDDTANLAEQFGATVVFEPVNQIARARNRGAQAARELEVSALIFVDADTRVSSELLAEALEQLGKQTVVGGGARIEPDRELRGMARIVMQGWNVLARKGGYAAGCFVYVRADVFAEVGGFSERVYAGEEIYLSRALKRWARRHHMRFHIIAEYAAVTSVRKLDWYSPSQLMRQAMLVLVPGAIYSRTLCRLWYDRRFERSTPDP